MQRPCGREWLVALSNMKEMSGDLRADSLTPQSCVSPAAVTGGTTLACVLSEEGRSRPWSLIREEACQRGFSKVRTPLAACGTAGSVVLSEETRAPTALPA